VAPVVESAGGIYQFIQTLLSLFQGPMLALLIMGILTRHASPTAGTVILVTGIALSFVLTTFGVNMLWVAFISFVYSMLGLWMLSYIFPNPLKNNGEEFDRLVFARA